MRKEFCKYGIIITETRMQLLNKGEIIIYPYIQIISLHLQKQPFENQEENIISVALYSLINTELTILDIFLYFKY